VAIPDIDQEAKELYKTFGGDHESDSGASPAFLQTDKRQTVKRQTVKRVQMHHSHAVKRQKHHMAKPAVPQADIDAAMQALKDIAKDTGSALSLMASVRHAEGGDQCTVLMQKFARRKAVRAKREAELKKRSQQLQEALHHSHSASGKTKHLRSHR